MLFSSKMGHLGESQNSKKARKTSHHPTIAGRHVFCGIRQSMPSISIASCARLRLILPSSAQGQTNRPRSRRLVNKHAPWPSHPLPGSACLHAREGDQLDLIPAPSSEQKQMAGERIARQNLFGLCRQPVKPAPHIRHTRSQPDLRIRQYRDHAASPRASSSTKPASAPSLTRSLRPFSNVISIWGGPVGVIVG